MHDAIVEDSLRTALFVTLILLSVLTVLFPSTTAATTTAAATAERTTTATYTSTALETSLFSTSRNMIVQTPLNISSQGVGFMAPIGKCSQFTMPLAVKSGTTLNLELTSSNPANLYVLPNDTYQTSPNGCNLIGSSLMAKNNFTDFRLHWTASKDGTVYGLLTGPNTIIILMDEGSTEPIQQTATVTYASTKTSLNLYSSTNVANYTTSTTAPSGYSFPLQGRFEFSFITFVVALLGPIFLLAFGKRFVRMTDSGRRRPDAR